MMIAGAIAYWCEGAKSKPYRTHDRVRLHQQRPSADPVLPAFLDVAGIPRTGLPFRV